MKKTFKIIAALLSGPILLLSGYYLLFGQTASQTLHHQLPQEFEVRVKASSHTYKQSESCVQITPEAMPLCTPMRDEYTPVIESLGVNKPKIEEFDVKCTACSIVIEKSEVDIQKFNIYNYSTGPVIFTFPPGYTHAGEKSITPAQSAGQNYSIEITDGTRRKFIIYHISPRVVGKLDLEMVWGSVVLSIIMLVLFVFRV